VSRKRFDGTFPERRTISLIKSSLVELSFVYDSEYLTHGHFMISAIGHTISGIKNADEALADFKKLVAQYHDLSMKQLEQRGIRTSDRVIGRHLRSKF
jgi:hypothetical protein